MEISKGIRILKHPLFFVVWVALTVFAYVFLDLKIAVFFHGTVDKYPDVIAVFTRVSLLGISAPYMLGTVILFLWGFFISENKNLAWAAVYLFLAMAVSGLICEVVKIMLARSRPSELFSHQLYGFYFFKFHNHMWSFPSSRTTTVAALGTACALLFRRSGAILFAFVFLVSAAQIVVSMHYLSDVMAGAYLGFIVAYWLHHFKSESQDLFPIF